MTATSTTLVQSYVLQRMASVLPLCFKKSLSFTPAVLDSIPGARAALAIRRRTDCAYFGSTTEVGK